MAPFDITDWCDFVRGVAEPDRDAELRRELESGKAPRRMIDTLSLVAEVGRLDSTVEIPEYAVRVAKAAGSLARPPVPSSGLGRFDPSRLLRYLPVSITFDSFTQPALAGTRKLQASDRRLSAVGEGYSLDLRLEQDPETHSLVVVGQLVQRAPNLDAEAEVSPAQDIPVLALEGDRIVGRTRTGPLGEFEAEGLPIGADRLCLLVGPRDCIDLSLEAG